MNQHIKYIRKTYELARQSAKQGLDPFGAILVHQDEIVYSTQDRCIQYADPTAHAELVAISEYCRKHLLITLEGYTLYCNVEPCVMCSGAIHWSRISTVVYGINQSALQKVSHGIQKPDCRSMINIGNHKIEIIGPLMPEEGMEVLYEFPFRSKNDRFSTYWDKSK